MPEDETTTPSPEVEGVETTETTTPSPEVEGVETTETPETV